VAGGRFLDQTTPAEGWSTHPYNGEMKMKKLNIMMGIALVLSIFTVIAPPVSAAGVEDPCVDQDPTACEWVKHVIEQGPSALERARDIAVMLADQDYDTTELKTSYMHAKAAYHRAAWYFDNGSFEAAEYWANQFGNHFYDMIWEVCDLAGVGNLSSGIEHAYFATFSL
jgi:hypothetical protein